MGRLRTARGSCCSWTYTWQPSTRLLRAMRGCPPSSCASPGKPWSGSTPCGEREIWRWTILRSSPAIPGQSLTTRPRVERQVNDFHLRQGTRSAQEFALEYRTLAAGAGWSDRALIDHYRCSLREDVRQEQACRDTTLPFDQLVDLSIRLDNLLANRGRSDWGLVVPSPRNPSPIPMELGGAVRRETGGGSSSCTICGRRGHIAGLLGIEVTGRSLWRHPGEPAPFSPRVLCCLYVCLCYIF